MIDYHMHTSLCGHASGTMEQYVQHALDSGLREIGFSGHYPYPPSLNNPPPACVIPADQFDSYLAEARRLRDKYAGRLSVRIGAEFDYLGPDISYHPLDVSRKLGLDFCLCSVHIVDGVVVDYSPDELRREAGAFPGGIDGLYRRYWETVLEICRSGWCTTLGHLDLIKKFSNEPDLRCSTQPVELIDRVLDAISAAGLVLEINTSGWDKPCAEQYPSLDILRGAVGRGIAITVGSDAHAPGEVGRKFGRLRGLLDQLGVTTLARFANLEREEFLLT